MPPRGFWTPKQSIVTLSAQSVARYYQLVARDAKRLTLEILAIRQLEMYPTARGIRELWPQLFFTALRSPARAGGLRFL